MSALRYHSSKPHGSWTPPVGSAAHEYKFGRVLPMQEERKFRWWGK